VTLAGVTLAGALRRLLAAGWLSLALALAGGAVAQTPLVLPGGNPPAAESAAGPGGLWQRSLALVHDTQRNLHRQLAGAVRGLKEGGFTAAGLLIGLSLLYGVFHAVGPGHGKAVISAYLLANESAVRRGVLLAFLASLVQGLSALLLVGVLAILLDMAGVAVRESVGTLESASYALVAAVGLWLLASLLRRRPQGGHGHDHDHSCGHLPDPALLERPVGGGLLGKAGGLVLAVGIRPCSGAVLVLLFALAHGVFLAGVAATFAMALGTAVTVSALAVLTLYSKRLALAAVGARQHWVEAAYRGLGLLGAGLLFLLGAALFWTSLAPGGPL
jgi:ABC-type nickel/cobalt efflux system permease component RcnA